MRIRRRSLAADLRPRGNLLRPVPHVWAFYDVHIDELAPLIRER